MKKQRRNSLYESLGRNPIHPFPARMAPELVLKYVSKNSDSRKILDPMMGSGTVIALARTSGHCAVGVDIDPLAVLISRVWSLPIDRLKILRAAKGILTRATLAYRQIDSRTAFPRRANRETRKFISYWFDPIARRQLTALATSIERIRDKDTRDVLWCAFSRLIITKQAGASLAMDLAHSRPHRAYKKAPLNPLEKFLSSVSFVVSNCISKADRSKGPAPKISIGDARRLRIASSSISLVLTSPPYLNAIDYMRCSKFSLVWMGHQVADLSDLRSRSVGSEIGARITPENRFAAQLIGRLALHRRLSNRHQAILIRFIVDMQSALHEVARVLVPGGSAIYVVGENTIRGTYIKNSRIMTAVAERAGLRLRSRTTRKLPANRRYMPPPSARGALPLDSRMRREVILTFSKPKNWKKSDAS